VIKWVEYQVREWMFLLRARRIRRRWLLAACESELDILSKL
jgi:hypothetical protein